MIDCLFALFVQPIIYIISTFIELFYPILSLNSFMGIIFICVFVNIICNPIYNIANKSIEKDKQKKQSMKWRIETINRHFSGHERRMLLNTYYKQNNFYPILSNLKNSFTFLIQIPFFIAAYKIFTAPNNPFMDPFFDCMNNFYKIGSLQIKLLPIFMTLINLISVFVFLNRENIFTKLKACFLPLMFLFLLYNAPAEIVIYWLLNNTYFLLRNIYMHARSFFKFSCVISVLFILMFIGLTSTSLKSLYLIIMLLLLSCVIFFIMKKKFVKIFNNKTLFYLNWSFLCVSLYNNQWLPWSFLLLAMQFIYYSSIRYQKYCKKEYTISTLFSIGLIMSCISGLITPMMIVSSSVAEFLNSIPVISFIFSHFVTCLGFFLIFPIFIYNFLNCKYRQSFCFYMGCIMVLSVLSWITFAPPSGSISIFMTFGMFDHFPITYMLFFKSIVLLLISILLWTAISLLKHRIKTLFVVSFMVACCIFSIKTIISMKNQIELYNKNQSKETKDYIFELSKNHPNVLVFFLDRAVSSFFPLIMEENKDLKDIYSGFIYYPNTISFATQTLYAAPALLGGYEYTPLRLQADRSKSMREKHNEAVSVLPFIFKQNGFNVFINWIPFVNYEDFDDGQIFKSNNINYAGPEIRDNSLLNKNNIKDKIQRNMFYFSFLKIMPNLFHECIYNLYTNSYLYDYKGNEFEILVSDTKTNYNTLKNTKIRVEETERPTFNLYYSLLTHSPAHLNASYEIPTTPEQEIKMIPGLLDKDTVQHYQVNVAAYNLIGDILLQLKQNGVYNNTKIVIISDHGWKINLASNTNLDLDLLHNSALLLVKDFGKTGNIKENNQFMTTADLPFLTSDKLIKNPKNPFTNQTITQNMKEKGVNIVLGEQSKWHPRHWDDKERHNLYSKVEKLKILHIPREGFLGKKITDFKIINSNKGE